MPSRRDPNPNYARRSHEIKSGSSDDLVLRVFQNCVDGQWLTQADIRNILGVEDKHVVQSAIFRLRHQYGYIIHREGIGTYTEKGKSAWRYRLAGRLPPLVEQMYPLAFSANTSGTTIVAELPHSNGHQPPLPLALPPVAIDEQTASEKITEPEVVVGPKVGTFVRVVGHYITANGTTEYIFRDDTNTEWRMRPLS